MILNTRQQQDNNSTIRFCTLLKKDANIFELLLKELPVISSHEVRSGVRPARPARPAPPHTCRSGRSLGTDETIETMETIETVSEQHLGRCGAGAGPRWSPARVMATLNKTLQIWICRPQPF